MTSPHDETYASTYNLPEWTITNRFIAEKANKCNDIFGREK